MTKATNLLNISHLDIETLWIVNIYFQKLKKNKIDLEHNIINYLL